jgi:hypothetical protein
MPAAPELVPEATQHVIARKAVGPVRRHYEERQLRQRLGETREEVERRLVGPLEIVEHEEGVLVFSDAREGGIDRLEQRRPVARGRGLSKLRKDQRQVGPQWPEVGEAVRVRPQVRAQGRDYRPIGRARALARAAPEDG